MLKRIFPSCLLLAFTVMLLLLVQVSGSFAGDPVEIAGSEWTTTGSFKEKVKKFGKSQSTITVDLLFGPQGNQAIRGGTEELAVPACGFNAVVTENEYSGLVKLTVSGVVTGGTSPPMVNHDGFYAFNGTFVESPPQFRYTRASETTCTCQLECENNFPVADLLAEAYPPFNETHEYMVLLDLGQEPDQFAFGIRDCGCFDNTGGLNVTIQRALAANEFLLIADDGEEQLLFPGTYTANSKGKLTLFPDINAFEERVKVLLEEAFEEMFPSSTIEVDVQSMKLKAKPKSKRGVETIKVKLKTKFLVDAEVDGGASQVKVKWSYKGRGGHP